MDIVGGMMSSLRTGCSKSVRSTGLDGHDDVVDLIENAIFVASAGFCDVTSFSVPRDIMEGREERDSEPLK